MNQPEEQWPATGVGSTDWYVTHLRRDAEKMAVAYEHGPTDAPVAACPGWDVTALVRHMSYIHRWAGWAFRNSRPPGDGEIPELPDSAGTAERSAWLRAGATALADAMAGSDPMADTWHVFPIERRNWVWIRRQAIETTLHRWDAETATVHGSLLDAELARTGVAEYLEVAVPRIAQRDQVTLPTATVRLEPTDTDANGAGRTGADLLLGPGDTPRAVISGSAEQLLLVLMNRAPRESLAISGDVAAADAWLSIPGW